MSRRRFSDHVGRRGAFLAAHGILALLLGWSYTIASVTPATEKTLHFALSLMPLWAYGVIWLVSGATAIVTGLWLRKLEVVGFTGAIVAPTLWGLVWLTADAPWQWSILSAAIFLAYAIPVGIVAGMPDIPRHPREGAL